MSKLRLNGTSSGYVEITAPATAANNTITLPSTTGSIIVQSTTGITSFASAPVVIGTGTSTGTASQMLQVTGGAYVSGDVGIGTASPQFKLDVFGTYSRFRTTSSFNGIQIVSSSITDVKWTDTTNDRGWIWSNRGDGAFALITENPSASFSEKLRILSAGGLTFNGDTAAANALDDYEEGTWSPTIGPQSGSGTFTGTANAYGGHYVKIGRMVYVSGNVRGSWTVGTASGICFITGLPFLVASGADNGWNACFSAINIPYHSGFTPDTGYIISGGMVNPASYSFTIYQKQTASASNPTLSISRLSTGTDVLNMHFSGVYLSAT